EAHVPLGYGSQLAPERVEHIAVQATRRALELRRVDQVRRADRGHPDGQRRVAADDRPRGACVVEVDVREQEVPEVGQREPVLRQPRFEVRQRGRGPAVEQSRAVHRVEQVDADAALGAAEVQVEEPQRIHNAIFAGAGLAWPAMRVLLLAAVVALVSAGSARADATPYGLGGGTTKLVQITYRAHDGVDRPAWLLLPLGYHGQSIPL